MLKNKLVRKLVWAGLVALMTMGARRLAATFWRRTAHEEPPARV